jgi:hypothetical protein
MKFKKQNYNKIDTKEIFKKVIKCKSEELENLLKHIETEIEKSKKEDIDLLLAKTMITSRLASVRSQN